MTETDDLARIDAAASLDDDLDDEAVFSAPTAGTRSQVYSVRVPVDRLEQVRRLAQTRGVQPTAMIREWVLGRLDDETARARAAGLVEAYDRWHILENWTGIGRMARAALGLHKPVEAPAGSVVCDECASVWPCNTFTAIEEAARTRL